MKITSEIDQLNTDEDRYADSTMCISCPLPNVVFSYETGFKNLQQYLAEMKLEVVRLAERIDKLDRRDIPRTDAE